MKFLEDLLPTFQAEGLVLVLGLGIVALAYIGVFFLCQARRVNNRTEPKPK